MRPALFVLVLLTLAACVDWQAAYDSAAQRDCRDIVNAEDRQDCLTQVERNSSARQRAGDPP